MVCLLLISLLLLLILLLLSLISSLLLLMSYSIVFTFLGTTKFSQIQISAIVVLIYNAFLNV